MLESEIIRWIVMGVLGLVVWFMKRTVEQTESSIKALKLEVDEIKANYLLRSDFKDFKQELRDMFENLRQDIRTLREHK